VLYLCFYFFFFFNDTATTEIYTLSLHDALPIWIETNYNTVPYDTRKPFDPSGLRLGTPALTTRGLTEAQMPQVAEWISRAVDAAVKDDEAALDRIAGEVRELLSAYPMPGYQA